MKIHHSIKLFYIFFITTIHTEGQSLDSFGKYSYPIFAQSGNVQHCGTAFFYKSEDTIYLVSNYHAIKGMSPMHNRLNWSSDTLYLKYPSSNSNESKLMAIDISENTIGKTEIFYMADRIDLFKIPITIPVDGKIFYINDIIDTSYFDKVPEEVFIFGYPNPQNIAIRFWSTLSKFEGTYSKNGFEEFYEATLKRMPLFNEKERMFGLSRFYYFIKPFIDKGYSGSPVVGKFINEKKEIVYKFFGVNFGNEPFSNQTWIIRSDVAFNYLNNR